MTRQRRFRRAERNAGFSAMVSALALIIRLPMLMSFANDGTRIACDLLDRFLHGGPTA
jgi:hypothetical protein